MKRTKKIIILLAGMLALAFGVQQARAGGEFPIAVTDYNECGLSVAFDGNNYLVGIEGDETHHANITAQMVSQTGALVGSRISVGRTGGIPLVAFDGTNYLMVWEDDATYPNSDIYGQFINTSGALVGSPFAISTAAGRQHFEFSGIAFGGTNYLVIWTDGRDSIDDQGPWCVYGQVVSKSGSLVGGEIRISAEPGHMPAIAFDGTNYLVVWVEDTHDTDYYGQFISPSGTLVDQNFVIESNNLPSDNPSFILFDGTRYVVNVQDRISADALGHYVRFVAKDGNVSPTRITLYEGQTFTGCYVYAFDGTNYLAILSEGWAVPPVTAKGRFYDINFNHIGDWFTIFETQGSKVPFGQFAIFDGTKYLAVTTRSIYTVEDPCMSNYGDVYGVFIGVIGDSDAFVIDISPEDKFGGTSAFDGTNYLVGIEVYRDDNWYAHAQMVTKTGELYGSEIVLSETSAGAGMPFIGFDDANYLAVWNDYRNGPDSDIYGQFISKSGTLVGSNFAISTATGTQSLRNKFAFDGTNYLVVWTDDRGGDMDVYGQLVSPSGSLVGSEIAIGTASYNQMGPTVAFDGTNYLVAWNDGHRLGAGGGYGEDIYGQFVTTSGSLSGSNFAINESSYPSDNPLSITFDGTNYLVIWMDEVGGAGSYEWGLFGQLVTTSGNPSGPVITITTPPGSQFLPWVDFDGTNYLVVWTDFRNDVNKNGHYDLGEGTGIDIYGQFLDTSGNLLGSEFAITNAANDQIFGLPCFGDTSYLVTWTDNRDGAHGLYQGFPTGDIYGVFVSQFGPTPPVSSLVGTWGIQSLHHLNNGSWATESSKVTFNNDGTGTGIGIWNDNGSVSSDSYTFNYTDTSNADGSITLTIDGILSGGGAFGWSGKVVISDDGKVMITDGTADTSKQFMMAWLKIDTTKTYSNADLSGEYYSIGYEHDALGGTMGYYRGWSQICTGDGGGNYSLHSTFNGDGSILTQADYGTYSVNPDGSIEFDVAAVRSYLSGDGKLGMWSNPDGRNDWANHFFMKKGDKTYSTADLEGTWAIAGFGDDYGTSFNAEFGFMTFDASGNYCYNSKNQRDGTFTTETGTGTFLVSADGSFGGSVTPGAPYYAGAIGNDGNIIIFNTSFDETSLYHREILIGVGVSAPPADTHGDGIEDNIDNCPSVYNTGQTDFRF